MTVPIDETIAHDFIFDKCIPFVEVVDEKVIIGASFTVEGNETPTHDFVLLLPDLAYKVGFVRNSRLCGFRLCRKRTNP